MTTEHPTLSKEYPMSKERRKAGMRRDNEIAIVEGAG